VRSGPDSVTHVVQQCPITKFCEGGLEHLHLADDVATMSNCDRRTLRQWKKRSSTIADKCRPTPSPVLFHSHGGATYTASTDAFARRFPNIAYRLTPSVRGSPRAIGFIVGVWKLEWLSYNLMKVAWWSTKSFGHNTSTWQTATQPRRHSKCRPNALRLAAKTGETRWPSARNLCDLRTRQSGEG